MKRKCEQTKCGFSCLNMGGCRPCDDCKCPPHDVDDKCDRCWNCEHDEGLLRWDDTGVKEEDTQKEEEKPLLVEVKIK